MHNEQKGLFSHKKPVLVIMFIPGYLLLLIDDFIWNHSGHWWRHHDARDFRRDIWKQLIH